MNMRKFLAVFLSGILLIGSIPLNNTAVSEDYAFSESQDGTDEMAIEKAAQAKKITIKGPKYVAKGKKVILKATVNPAKASQKVTWSTSDKKIATVSSKGVVKGVKAGKVTITATSKANPKVKKTWKMEVKAKAVSKVKITGAKDLDLAGTKTLTLKAKITPSKASKEVEWKSSNTKVVKVTEKGKVTAVGAGTAKITATAMDGSKKKATVTITVINSAEQGPTEVPVTIEPPTEEPPTEIPVTEAPQQTEEPTEAPTPTPTPTPEPTPTPTPEPTDYDFSAGQFSYHYSVASDDLTLTGSSATGHASVPSQENGKPVTQIGENALTAGNVNAVTIPETVTSVASQHFPNQINYIELKGKDTSLTDLEKVNYIIAPAGGAAEQTANALGIVFVDASRVRSQDGFLYVVDNGQATLLCAVDSSAISGEVTLPETVDGVPVTGAESNALNGCADQITQLNYPESMSLPEGILGSDKLNKIIKVKGIVLSGMPEEMTAGETALLTAAVQPEDATNKALTWSSSDESVLSVDENGTVTAVAYGEATVIATAKDGSGIASDPITIRVWNRVESIAIQNLPEVLVIGDAQVALQAVITPDAATLKDANITWSLEGEGAEIVEGSLKPIAVGTVKVTASVQDKADNKEITIIRKIEDITISGAPEELEAGETVSLTAAVTPEDATDKFVTWSSSDPTVATVSAEGVVTAIGYGTATLTAAAQDISGVTKSVTIQVWNVPESITIQNLPAEFEAEGTAVLTAVISPNPDTLKRKEILWSSSNEAVAAIAEGTLTAASAGTAIITAQIRDTELSDSKEIRVYDKAQSVIIHNAQAELTSGETLQLSAEVQPDTAIQTVTWSTSDEAIATITEGLVTAVAGGDVTITAQAGSQSDAITIHVWDQASEIKITGAEPLDLYQDRKLTAQLSAEVLPATAHLEVVWSSENPEIATVSENGLVTAVAVGTATIKATAMDGSGVTATTMVTVERSTYIVRENEDGTLTLCALELQDGKAVIPSAVNGKTISTLAEGLFKGNLDLIELIVPATITVIPDSLCEGCTNLRKVSLSDNVVLINKAAFKNCTALTTLDTQVE